MSLETATARGVVDDANANENMINELAAFLGADEPPKEKEPVRAAEEEEPVPEPEEEPQEETETEDMEESERDEDETDEGEQPDEDKRWMPHSLEELAEALETEPDQVALSLKVKTKIDGETGEATLSDLLKSYQLEGTLNKRLEAVANERKEFEAARQNEIQALQTKYQEANNMISAAEQMVFAEYQSIDWADLKENDPTEYLMQQQKLQERYSSINQVKSQMEQERQQEEKKQQEMTQQQVAQYVAVQREEAFKFLPEWKDEKVRQTEYPQLREYLKTTYGVNDQQMDNTLDHVSWVNAYKAMKYDQMHSKADPKAKQLRNKPKFVPPGSRQGRQSASEKQRKSSFDKAKKLQTEEAWTQAIEQRLFS